VRVRGGFTLIELTIALIIVGVLAAVAVPTYNNIMQTVASQAQQNNLQVIYNAEKTYYLNNGAYCVSSIADQFCGKDLLYLNTNLKLNVVDSYYDYFCDLASDNIKTLICSPSDKINHTPISNACLPASERVNNCQTICVPDCTNATCGQSDGCGGFCKGSCSAGLACNSSFQCVGCSGCGGCSTEDYSNGCVTCPATCPNGTCNAQGQCQCTPTCPACTTNPNVSNGCGGTCPVCNGTCNAGQCSGGGGACTPNCYLGCSQVSYTDANNCASNDCPANCSNGTCQNDTCINCSRNCSDSNCGDDGCGGSCGSCQLPKVCTTFGPHNLWCSCTPNCPACVSTAGLSDGCGGTCPVNCLGGGTCSGGQCVGGCTYNCSDSNCGSDGCGGSCGSCQLPKVCTTYGPHNQWCSCTPNCPACVSTAGLSDGCGGTCPVNCLHGGTCSGGQCVGGCIRNCTISNCGDDGCGGSCGGCPISQTCHTYSQNDNWCVCVPNCPANVECGDDGCGGSCGTCGAGQVCNSGQCVAQGGGNCTLNCNDGNCHTSSYPDLNNCGTCPANCNSPYACSANSCVLSCIPNCNDGQCHSSSYPDINNCGTTCPANCPSPATCNGNQCSCVLNCNDGQCHTANWNDLNHCGTNDCYANCPSPGTCNANGQCKG